MNENYNAYRSWAPNDALWSQWAKPVLFSRVPQKRPEALTTPDINWAPYPDGSTALLIDLPGKDGVLEGIAIARFGYRPVPLYNGVYGHDRSTMAIDVTDIVEALYCGAEQIAASALRADAPPAFLLDASRMKGIANQLGKYDNRWCVFPQDMPSASFLLQNGIHQVAVRTDHIQNDLTHILRRYQEKGLVSIGSALQGL